jgi:hypothetical protein
MSRKETPFMNGDPLIIGTSNQEEQGTSLTLTLKQTEAKAGFEVRVDGTPHRSPEGAILGDGDTVCPGVVGYSVSSDAVRGFSEDGAGVSGVSYSDSFPFGAGVQGNSQLGPGVLGESQHFWGVQGISHDRYGVGVAGLVDSGSGSGVYGQSYGGIGVNAHSKTMALFAYAPTAVAGHFNGAVFVEGDFTVVGGAKSAAVLYPDGSHRRLDSLESPESWFEDIGTGRLRRGRAEVKLDAGFRAVIARGNQYHVFLSPRGDSKGLYVSRQRPDGFEIREQQGGKSTLEFTYRVVAKRKDIKGVRLEKVRLPKVPVDTARLERVAAERLKSHRRRIEPSARRRTRRGARRAK